MLLSDSISALVKITRARQAHGKCQDNPVYSHTDAWAFVLQHCCNWNVSYRERGGMGLSSPQVREHHSIVILEYFWFLSLLFASVLLNNMWKFHSDGSFAWEAEPGARACIWAIYWGPCQWTGVRGRQSATGEEREPVQVHHDGQHCEQLGFNSLEEPCRTCLRIAYPRIKRGAFSHQLPISQCMSATVHAGEVPDVWCSWGEMLSDDKG